MNDSIKKMLELIDKNLMITGIFHKEKTLVINDILSPDSRARRSCGSTVVDENKKSIMVKNSRKKIIVHFDQYNHIPNGKIEAKNTHIKTMKLLSYGFESFENMKIRIFLTNQLIKVR